MTFKVEGRFDHKPDSMAPTCVGGEFVEVSSPRLCGIDESCPYYSGIFTTERMWCHRVLTHFHVVTPAVSNIDVLIVNVVNAFQSVIDQQRNHPNAAYSNHDYSYQQWLLVSHSWKLFILTGCSNSRKVGGWFEV